MVDPDLTRNMLILILVSVIGPEGLVALQRYFDRGGNFIGIHCAAWTHVDCGFFVRQLGASFDYHPDFCPAVGTSRFLETADSDVAQVVEVIDQTHPSTKMLPAQWPVEDEMCGHNPVRKDSRLTTRYIRYNFTSDPRKVGATIILSVDESSYTGWHTCW
jgi:hypothetical protein